MKIDLDSLSSAELRSLFTSLQLEESATGESTLSMEFSSSPDWLTYMEPVVLMRGGKPLFCGRITEISTTNDTGSIRYAATATNYWYLFDHLPAAVQIAQLKEEAVTAGKMLSRQLSNSLKSWDSIAQGIKISCSRWTCSNSGAVNSSGTIALNVSKALYGMTPTVSKNRIFSTREIFTMLEEANPDAIFIAEPGGTLRVISIANCPTLDIPINRINAASDISPMRDQDIDGVCVAVTDVHTSKKIYKQFYPSTVNIDSANVVFFTAEVEHDPKAQLAHMLEQAKGWYRAANTRQWSGSISAYPEDFASSPLGYRVNITGDGVPPEWKSMNAICTDVSWDFFANRVELSLGKTMTPPTLHELEFEDPNQEGGGGEENESFVTNISMPYYTRSESQSESLSQSVPPEHYCGCSENWSSLKEYLEEVAKMFDYNDYEFPRWTPPNENTDMEMGGNSNGG